MDLAVKPRQFPLAVHDEGRVMDVAFRRQLMNIS